MNLRPYQAKINKECEEFLFNSEETRAQVYAPTGAGKTVCFTELIKTAIAKGKKNIIVLHHRLALSQDQLGRFKDDIGHGVHFTSFHSGSHVNNDSPVREISTVNKETLLKTIKNADTVLGKPHITFTTYNSYEKLLDVRFDIIICDEAHSMVQDRFAKYLPDMNADKIMFFTATPIREDMEGSGMMNLDLFGKVVAEVMPKELIMGGYIVAPVVHVMECGTNKKAEKVNVSDVIIDSFVFQHAEITGHGMPFHQMLVACRDVAVDIDETINTEIRKIRDGIEQKSQGKIKGESVDIYTVAANVVFLNGTPYAGERKDALNDVKRNGRNTIVAHYDTLSEGIDISTLSGVVIMREMTKSKMIQTIGRPARPCLDDLDSVTFEPRSELFDIQKGIDTRKKPRSIVTFPVIDGEWICGGNAKSIAEAFITAGYDDLMDYMYKGDFKPTGKKNLELPMDDDPTFMSSVISAKVERELADFWKLFEITN